MSWAAQQYALGCPDLLSTSVIAGWIWCRSLEEDAKFDEEIAELLAGANGDPNIIEQRVCVCLPPCLTSADTRWHAWSLHLPAVAPCH